jgi:hypothetical protein
VFPLTPANPLVPLQAAPLTAHFSPPGDGQTLPAFPISADFGQAGIALGWLRIRLVNLRGFFYT